MYRLIYRLRITFDRTEQGGNKQVCVNLDSRGCNLLKTGARPRPPKQRIVDLRVGDQFLFDGQWRQVLDIVVEGESILTDEQSAEHRARGEARGWLVQAPEGYVSPLTGGGLRRDGR